jgi:Tfp pilus assembly protein FimT
MVALAVATLLATIAAPNLRNWMRAYTIKSAAQDLFSNMQSARIGAIKENRQWKISFNISGSYTIIKCLTSTCESGTLNTDYKEIKTINFNNNYNNDVIYKNPVSSTVVENNPLVFNSNGLTNQGYVYIADKRQTKYYRIGLSSFSGSIEIQKWNGSDWE